MPPGYGGGYAGDPRGRSGAIEARQQGQADVQSQVDSFSSFGSYNKGPSKDMMRFRTYSAPAPIPKTPVQKVYNEIRTKTPDIPSTYDGPPQSSTYDGPQKTVGQSIYESVVGSPAKPANLWGNKNQQGHFKNQQIIENQAKLGNISHKYADQLKGKDIAQLGLNPMLGMFGGPVYQMLSNTIDQFDSSNILGSIWGGMSSGANQAVSNIQGILSAYGMWNIGNAPPQSDSNSAWLDLLQRLNNQTSQGGGN